MFDRVDDLLLRFMELGRLVGVTMKNRFILYGSMINLLFATSHLLPPYFEFFEQEMIFRSLARAFHGVIEFLSFSLLIISGNLTSLGQFLMISILGFLGLLVIQRVWNSGLEGKEMIVLLVLFNCAFGIGSVYAGNLLVEHHASTICNQGNLNLYKVGVYSEMGWDPGFHYFLAESKDMGESWHQIAHNRLKNGIENPCDSIEFIFGELP
jgi:hypothetical protein